MTTKQMKHATTRQSVVGQTRDVGFQIGVRKTIDVSPERAWQVITSAEGVKCWLGAAPQFKLQKGATFETSEGARCEMRVNTYDAVTGQGHFRMTWQPKGWERHSLIQVRVNPRGDKAEISFHQEHLAGPKERAQMRQRWQKALQELQTLL